MLAKFENGYYLEVFRSGDDYEFNIYDNELDYVDGGWTEYRSMEMYYPMNEIGYILEYCIPEDFNDLDGKYEILEFDTMDELEEDPDGEWVLERQGTDNDDIRYYKSVEAARTIMKREFEEMEGDELDLQDNYCWVGRCHTFQCWTIYKKETFKYKKNEILHEIDLALDRIDNGIAHYAYELEDTYVAYNYVEKLRKLINELKEVI